MGHATHTAEEHKLQIGTVMVIGASSSALWIVLVGSINRDECLVGCFAVVLTMLVVLVLRRCYPGRVAMRLRDTLQVAQVPAAVVRDSWAVTTVLFSDLLLHQPIPDLYRAVRWEHGHGGAHLRGRGVLATAAISASPNTIVLGIDNGASLMILHQVKRAPMDAMAVHLGAMP